MARLPCLATVAYGALLCRTTDLQDPTFDFPPDRTVRIRASSPSAGLNYTAESLGHARAIAELPQNCPLTIVSDAQAALQVERRTLEPSAAKPLGIRLRTAARPIHNLLRSMARRRAPFGAPITRTFVRAHTGRTNILSRGNAIADKEASAAGALPAVPPFLLYEEPVVLWICKEKPSKAKPPCLSFAHHIISNLRKPILRKGDEVRR